MSLRKKLDEVALARVDRDRILLLSVLMDEELDIYIYVYVKIDDFGKIKKITKLNWRFVT